MRQFVEMILKLFVMCGYYGRKCQKIYTVLKLVKLTKAKMCPRTTTTQKTFVKLRVDGCVTLKEKGTLTFGNVIQCFIKRGDGIPPFTLGNLLLQGQFQMSCVFDDNELGIRLCCLSKS